MPRIVLVFFVLFIISCGNNKFESALKYVPKEFSKAEVTNWNILKKQFNIQSEEDFYTFDNWTNGKFSSGLVWSFDLLLRDKYKQYLGFSYPDVEYEVFVDVRAFEALYILKYSENVGIEPMKNFLDSGNYKKFDNSSFEHYAFSGTEEELRMQLETGVVFYGKYSNIAYNESERIILFSNKKEVIDNSIFSGINAENCLEDDRFKSLYENENQYYSYRISQSSFTQIPFFSNTARMQDYEGRLSEYMGMSVSEMRSLSDYDAYWLGLSFQEEKSILESEIIYTDESALKNDLSLRRTCITNGFSFKDRTPNSKLFRFKKYDGTKNKIGLTLESLSSKKDLFNSMIVIGDLGFLLMYKSEVVVPTSSSH